MSEWLLATSDVSNWVALLVTAALITVFVAANWAINDSIGRLAEARLLLKEVNALLDEADAANAQEPSHDPS